MRVATVALTCLSAALAIAAFTFYQERNTQLARVATLEDDLEMARRGVPRSRSEATPPPESDSDDERADNIPVDSVEPVERDTRASEVANARRPDRTERSSQRNRLEDPAFKALELARHKQDLRRRNLGLAAALGLSADQEDALLTLLANQTLEKQLLDLGTDRPRNQDERNAQRAQREALQREHEQQLQAQLGFGDYEQLRAFQQQVPERQLIGQLRSRLDERSVLRDDQAKRLTTALFEERQLYLQQVRSLEGFGGYTSNYPMVAMPRGDPASRVRFAEEQVARTEAFLQRLRDRAAPILNAEQMHRFEELQEEQLTQAQQVLERMKRRSERGDR